MPTYKIKEKFWSWGDDFKITNADDESDFYMVKGKVFSWGDDLKIYNKHSQEVMRIKQKLFKLLPQYIIEKNGQEFATVNKEFTVFKDKFTMDVPGPNDYTIDGKLFDHEYTFKRVECGEVAKVSKKFFAWTDSYAVKIEEGQDVEAILACCVVIDQCSHDDDNAITHRG